MKIIKFSILYLFVMAITSLQVYGQNPIWVMPPIYYDVQSYPLPTVQSYELGYKGEKASFVSNGMLGADGDILFFIVDGLIYNKDGYTIGNLSVAFNGGFNVKGSAELVIIPAPDNCEQYYIVLAGAEVYNGSSPLHSFVALLDMSVESDYTAVPGALGKILFCNKIQDYISDPGVPPITYIVKTSSLYFAASNLRADNSRFFYVSGPRGLYRFKIDENGFAYDDYFWSYETNYINDVGVGEDRRGEMELIELNDGGNIKYRIAVALKMDLKSFG